MTNNNDIGKWFEDKITKALKHIQSERHAMYHRFPDSKAARNILSPQPADFLFAMDGTAFLIEAKCSETHRTFRKGFSSLWPKPEAAFHRKWHRSRCPSLVLFCDYVSEAVEIWPGQEIAILRALGKPIPKNSQPVLVGHADELQDNIVEAIELIGRNV